MKNNDVLVSFNATDDLIRFDHIFVNSQKSCFADQPTWSWSSIFGVIAIPMMLTACGGGGGGDSNNIVTVSNSLAVTERENTKNEFVIKKLDQDYIVSIDLRFDQERDFTTDGFPVNGFDHVKKFVDDAKARGFTAIELDTTVPINADTGELQMLTPEGEFNRDKSLPDDTWKIISYAESIGLDTSLRLNIVNAINDDFIMSDRVGKNFDTNKFFHSVETYETEIAMQAQLYGVDQIVIGGMNFGFDKGYQAQWQSVVDSIRSVYSGELAYLSFYNQDNIVPWQLVDNIAAKFNPDLGQATYDESTIVDRYHSTAEQWDPHSTVAEKLDSLFEKYPDKDIMLYGISKSPVQTALNEDIPVHEIMFRDWGVLDHGTIDFDLAIARYNAFFEFFGNYADDRVSAVQFWQYAPWAEAHWIKYPMNFTGQAYNAYARGGYFLNYQPEILDALDDYLLSGWGYNTLELPDSNDNKTLLIP
jgi:hypothetical protein